MSKSSLTWGRLGSSVMQVEYHVPTCVLALSTRTCEARPLGTEVSSLRAEMTCCPESYHWYLEPCLVSSDAQ